MKITALLVAALVFAITAPVFGQANWMQFNPVNPQPTPPVPRIMPQQQIPSPPAQMPPPSITPMYDNSYSGPMNIYGQAVMNVVPRQDAQGQPTQEFNNGLIFMAGEAVQNVGGYLWGYMPAPVRGVENPLTPPQGSGQVFINFVPGDR